MGFPLNWHNSIRVKVLVSYPCFKENFKLTKELVLYKLVSWPSVRLSINATKDSVLLLIGGRMPPAVVLFDAFGWFILSQLYNFLILLVRKFDIKGYYYTIHVDVALVQCFLSRLAHNLFLNWKFLNYQILWYV